MSDGLVAGLAIGKTLADLGADVRLVTEETDLQNAKLDTLRGAINEAFEKVDSDVDLLRTLIDEEKRMINALDGMLATLSDRLYKLEQQHPVENAETA
jgi:hypothetical protein